MALIPYRRKHEHGKQEIGAHITPFYRPSSASRLLEQMRAICS
jgi:hypothetical protein